MNDNRNVTTHESRDAPGRGGAPEAALRPPVDIYEDASGITVLADMPGVAKERLRVEVDNDTLLIEGESVLDVPAALQALYADVRSQRYRRTFTLSSELHADNITASLKDGVLTVYIPKREEVRPRKIPVRSSL